jgi:signal transduction histidine kinase
MVSENVLARIADNPKLPTPPTLTMQILDQASRPTCTIHEMAKIISHDPGLCGKMLKLVNSTMFGLARPVTSVDRAMNLLGLKHVRSLVLSLSLSSMRFRSASAERMKTYWKSSVTTAIVCRELALSRGKGEADSEMVAGLLCDIGELLLQESYPDKYAVVLDSPPEMLRKNQCALEAEAVGVDHAEVGAYCLSRWKMPEDLTLAIRWHHKPEAAPAPAMNRAYLLYFASCIAHMYRAADRSDLLAEIVSLARQRFGMNDKSLVAFLDGLKHKIDDFAALIDVEMEPSESFADLFAKATENLTKFAVEASLDNFRVLEEKSQIEQRLNIAKESLQKTEEQLRQAQKMEAIGRLAGGVAHDFNNLLTIILGNCDLVLDLPCLDEEARSMIDLIRQTGERASELTRQLLAFSRKQRLVPEIIHLNAIVGNLSRMLRRLLGDDVELVTRLADDLGLVKIDPGQIGQVLMNLAVNARDAMPDGGTLTLETFNLELGEDLAAQNADIHIGPHVVIAVTDTGCGMDETTMSQIFEPFFTTKEKGKGTGLGLATVHGIVRQSGGHITVSSVVNQGTVFHIYLPAVLSDDSVVRKIDSAVLPLNGSETILLAEDKDDVRDLTRKALEMYGYKVLEARDGAEALEVEQRSPDSIHLLLADMVMPVMNGCALARKIVERRPDIRILFVSGHADHGLHQDETSASMPFLQKPFTPKSLAAKVREVLTGERT